MSKINSFTTGCEDVRGKLLKVGYTQGELQEDFDDFKTGFNAPNHAYWKFALLTCEEGENDCEALIIDIKNSAEYCVENSYLDISAKISEICQADTEDMFGVKFASAGLEAVIISALDEPDEDYECIGDVLGNIGGTLEMAYDSVEIPDENPNSLFCLCEP